MILVDTSVWVASFRSRRPLDPERWFDLEEAVTCLPVIQEVLQGFADERAYRLARDAILAFPRVDDPLPLERVESAADLYRRARRAGLTVRSSVDCIIAASAVHHDLDLMHVDRDYDTLARVSTLRVRRPEVAFD